MDLWLGKHISFIEGKLISFVLEHLIESNHPINSNIDFKIIYVIHLNLPRILRIQLLKTIEALAIHEIKSGICVQKKYVLCLSLT